LNSGIGDKQALLALNITPIHDLPSVGKNLSEHPAVPTIWNTRNPNLGDTTAAFNAAFAEWNATRTGRLTMTSSNIIGWLRMNESNPTVRALLTTHGDPAPGPKSPHFELIPTIVCYHFFSPFFALTRGAHIPEWWGSRQQICGCNFRPTCCPAHWTIPYVFILSLLLFLSNLLDGSNCSPRRISLVESRR
jgi:hypothetical protein